MAKVMAVRRVKSSSSKEKYELAVYDNNTITCSCPFGYFNNPINIHGSIFCKHMKRVLGDLPADIAEYFFHEEKTFDVYYARVTDRVNQQRKRASSK